MSKKFFSLIYGDSIHVAPKGKVIPSSAFSKLIDAEEALKKVQEDSERYKQEVSEECEKLKEAAQKEGFEEGFKTWIEQIGKLEQEIASLRKDNEKVLIPVALKAAKKILGREIELSETAIVDIVTNVLKSVATHKRVAIYVNRGDFEKLETSKNRLKQVFENLESISLTAREDVKPGGCIIETEVGIINALEKAFETLKAKKT